MIDVSLMIVYKNENCNLEDQIELKDYNYIEFRKALLTVIQKTFPEITSIELLFSEKARLKDVNVEELTINNKHFISIDDSTYFSQEALKDICKYSILIIIKSIARLPVDYKKVTSKNIVFYNQTGKKIPFFTQNNDENKVISYILDSPILKQKLKFSPDCQISFKYISKSETELTTLDFNNLSYINVVNQMITVNTITYDIEFGHFEKFPTSSVSVLESKFDNLQNVKIVNYDFNLYSLHFSIMIEQNDSSSKDQNFCQLIKIKDAIKNKIHIYKSVEKLNVIGIPSDSKVEDYFKKNIIQITVWSCTCSLPYCTFWMWKNEHYI